MSSSYSLEKVSDIKETVIIFINKVDNFTSLVTGYQENVENIILKGKLSTQVQQLSEDFNKIKKIVENIKSSANLIESNQTILTQLPEIQEKNFKNFKEHKDRIKILINSQKEFQKNLENQNKINNKYLENFEKIEIFQNNENNRFLFLKENILKEFDEKIETSWEGPYWGGLAISTYQTGCYIDGSVSNSDWWFAIGAFQNYGTSKTFPGPRFGPSNTYLQVSSTYLWVRIDGTRFNEQFETKNQKKNFISLLMLTFSVFII